MLTSIQTRVSPGVMGSSSVGGTMSGTNSTLTPFFTSENSFPPSTRTVTSVAIDAVISNISPVIGDHAWVPPLSDANDIPQARSIAEAPSLSKQIAEPSTDAHDQLGITSDLAR